MTDAPLPDPFNQVEVNRWMIEQIVALDRGHAEKRVNASEAARALGYNQKFFHGKPWRIPGFGLSGFQHSISEWKSWNERPEAERRSEWESMSLRSRRNARGIA